MNQRLDSFRADLDRFYSCTRTWPISRPKGPVLGLDLDPWDTFWATGASTWAPELAGLETVLVTRHGDAPALIAAPPKGVRAFGFRLHTRPSEQAVVLAVGADSPASAELVSLAGHVPASALAHLLPMTLIERGYRVAVASDTRAPGTCRVTISPPTVEPAEDREGALERAMGRAMGRIKQTTDACRDVLGPAATADSVALLVGLVTDRMTAEDRRSEHLALTTAIDGLRELLASTLAEVEGLADAQSTRRRRGAR